MDLSRQSVHRLKGYINLRRSLLVAGLGKTKTSSEINKVTLTLFSGLSNDRLKTMTFDNGKE